jgi:hypothetical protein
VADLPGIDVAGDLPPAHDVVPEETRAALQEVWGTARLHAVAAEMLRMPEGIVDPQPE